MASLEWSEQLALGNARMDDTHREFLDCCQALTQAGSEDFLPALDALIEHTVSHFEQENRWMQAVNFPGCHLTEHDRVLAVMREVRDKVAQGDGFLGRRLVEELPQWFETHATGMDAALAFYLEQVGYDCLTETLTRPLPSTTEPDNPDAAKMALTQALLARAEAG